LNFNQFVPYSSLSCQTIIQEFFNLAVTAENFRKWLVTAGWPADMMPEIELELVP
jgi:hypothetical protein